MSIDYMRIHDASFSMCWKQMRIHGLGRQKRYLKKKSQRYKSVFFLKILHYAPCFVHQNIKRYKADISLRMCA